MEVIDYLKEHGLEQLVDKFSIAAKRHKQHPNLVQLKYSQLDSPMASKVVQQSRGIVLDEANDWAIVSYPFDKFFNYGEHYAADIDWKTARVFEKLDGALITLYHYQNEWHVASSGLPDASGFPRNQTLSIAQLFWEAWEQEGYELPLSTTVCYMFEIVGPAFEVLVPYENLAIKLIGARDLTTLQEVALDDVLNTEWKRANTFQWNNAEEVLQQSEALNPMNLEGFVVCDAAFNRVKVKSPQYVKISLLKGAKGPFTDRYLLEIIRINEGDEFLAYFEELRPRYEELKTKYNALVTVLEQVQEELKEVEDKKELGLRSQQTPFPALFFQLKAGNVASVKAYLKKVKVKNLLAKL